MRGAKSRHIIFLASLCLNVCAVCLPAADEKQAESAAAAVHLEQEEIDLGPSIAGERLTFSFFLGNAGDEDLLIHSMRACCLCELSASTRLVRPDESAIISVFLSTDGWEGPLTCASMVRTSDPATPQVALIARTTVEPAFDLHPAAPIAFDVFQGDPWEVDVSLRPRLDSLPRIQSLEIEGSGIECELLEAAGRAEPPGTTPSRNEAQIIRIRLLPAAPVGRVAARIIAQPDDFTLPCLRIPVTGTIRGDIEVDPPRAAFGVLKAEQSADQSRTVKIVRLRGSRIQPAAIDPLPWFLKAVLEVVEEGERVDLTVSLTGRPPKGPFMHEIALPLDSPPGVVIRVPASGLIE